MKPLTLYPHELNRLLSTGSVTVWRPIDRIGRHGKVAQFGPSDTPGYEWHFRCKRGLWQDYRDAELIKVAPHPPGSEAWVRETWAKSKKSDIRQVCYAADGRWGSISADHQIYFHGWTTGVTGKSLSDWKNRKGHWVGRGYFGPWRSPVTMPRRASRLSVVSKAVQARQVQGVLDIDAEAAGFGVGATIKAERFGGRLMSYGQYRFVEWWHARYGDDEWAWATTLERKEQ